MLITLQGNLVLVDIDGKRVTRFDPQGKDVPADREWYEPKREPKRPTKGHIGLQNHDPGDVVAFKEVSVRPLPPPDLSATTAVVLVVRGTLSTLLTAEGASALVSELPRARLLEVADAGHNVHVEQPDAFLAAVLPFLEAAG